MYTVKIQATPHILHFVINSNWNAISCGICQYIHVPRVLVSFWHQVQTIAHCRITAGHSINTNQWQTANKLPETLHFRMHFWSSATTCSTSSSNSTGFIIIIMMRRQLRSVATTLHDDRDPVPSSTPVWYSVAIHCQSARSKSYEDVQELSARQRRAGIRNSTGLLGTKYTTA